jgi:hypothetical protein
VDIDACEEEASHWATGALIPSDIWNRTAMSEAPSISTLYELAATHSINPAILQRTGWQYAGQAAVCNNVTPGAVKILIAPHHCPQLKDHPGLEILCP